MDPAATMKQILLISFCCCFIMNVLSHPLDDKNKENQKAQVKSVTSSDGKEKLQGAASSMYHSLPMPFVNYPFPFVNSYTTRYFPYGYAGLGYGTSQGFGPFGYGFGFGHYV